MTKFSTIAAGALWGLLTASTASAHYVYSILVIDGQQTPDWQYIRQNSNNIQPHKEFLVGPSDDFRCNAGSQGSAPHTDVAVIGPGTRLGFKLWNNGQILHPGPSTIHMSRAPGDVRDYDGSGDWFKVYEDVICGPQHPLQDTDWCSWDQAVVEFTVPHNTPPGQYLVRVEHIALHGAESGDTEFYFTCAQVEVTGDGNGNPGPLVKIPGLYDSNDPALRFFIYGAQEYPYNQVGSHTVWSG
ncbi:glycoside hydrolase family 61 protein [Sodiomyces alcalophilus JCM 7366]|uniref:glycoside hydrolase family 61 protein n=1 Tax=Sodiomyces alcalophilus JCM 7366 TaxID=591952 RepID=UPI0039B68F7E